MIKSKRFLLLTTIGLVTSFNSKAENPMACLDTTLGQICIELFEQEAPKTVQNFIAYVEAGAYDGTAIHRSEPGFIIQGGGYFIVEDDDTGFIDTQRIDRFPSVENEFSISNTRGTIAMAKIPDQPDSATSEWFINLADNSSNLDNQNSGFTVFGRVVDDDMVVVDDIASLPRFNFVDLDILNTTPTVNYDGSVKAELNNFVYVDKATILIANNSAIGNFQNNRLVVPVDAGSFGKLNVEMELLTVQPEITFRLDLAGLTPLADENINMAVYNERTLILEIASVDIEGASTVKNVVMEMTDTERLIFTVIEIEGL